MLMHQCGTPRCPTPTPFRSASSQLASLFPLVPFPLDLPIPSAARPTDSHLLLVLQRANQRKSDLVRKRGQVHHPRHRYKHGDSIALYRNSPLAGLRRPHHDPDICCNNDADEFLPPRLEPPSSKSRNLRQSCPRPRCSSLRGSKSRHFSTSGGLLVVAFRKE